jgi:hypothetical protein
VAPERPRLTRCQRTLDCLGSGICFDGFCRR